MVDRLTLKQLILQKIQSKEYTLKELAPIAGYTGKNNDQNFKRALMDDREFADFQAFVDMVEYIWKDEVVKKMSQCVTEVDPNGKCARALLEYLSTNRRLDELKTLLCRMENCSNKVSKEFAKAYTIQHYCQSTFPNMDCDEVIRKAKSFKTNNPDLQVFLKLIETHTYHYKGNYHMTKILAEEIELYLSEMDNDFLKNSYTLKLSEIMSWIELRVFNNPKQCRKYADQLINSKIGKQFKAFANFQKGYSYFFTDYDKSVKYFSESLRLYKESDGREWVIKDLEEKIEFAKVYWNKLEKPQCYDEKNYFLMNIKRDVNVEKSLEKYNGDKIDEPMMLFLKGYNNKDYTILIESALAFVEKGDSFLANLPRNALLEIGYGNIHLIDRLISIRKT